MTAPIFVLGPDRSFTSLIAAMLGQHPALYSFPELNLPVAMTVQGWLDYTHAPSKQWLRDGLLRALAEIESGAQTDTTVAKAEAWLHAHPKLLMKDLLASLSEKVAPKRLVEASPHAVTDGAQLARLKRFAPEALFLHVTRHPFTASRSLAKTDPFSLAMRIGMPEALDRRITPPVFDPQFHWHGSHRRILESLADIPPAQQRRVRGEDVLADPAAVLADLCAWAGVSTDPAVIAKMLHPEDWLFAKTGPDAAPHGVDAGFLEAPALRAFTPPKAPLSGPLPWRGDGGSFTIEVREFARIFGYDDVPLGAPDLPAGFDGQNGALVALEPDGHGVPMAHATQLDNSYSSLPPLTQLTEVDYRTNPARTWMNFGSYSGTDITISVFDSQNEPAMVAIRNSDQRELWQTDLDVLPSLNEDGHLRWVSGVLLARMRFEDGTETPCIFAGNEAEIVCISQATGAPIWRNRTGKAGRPHAIRFTRDLKLIFVATPPGEDSTAQLVKMDPLTGDIQDMRALRTTLNIHDRDLTGGFQVSQPIIVDGDHAFVEGMFLPDTQQPRMTDAYMPNCLMRFQVSGARDGKIRPRGDRIDVIERVGVVGNRRKSGALSALHSKDDTLVVISNSFASPANVPNAAPVYQIKAYESQAQGLSPLWTLPLYQNDRPSVAMAAAIDPITHTYVFATRFDLHLVGQAPDQRGDIVPDLSVPAEALLAENFRAEALGAEISSPIMLCRDGHAQRFYAYVALAAWHPAQRDSYAVLTALLIETNPWSVTPIWSASMAADAEGLPRPAARSYAQPALFARSQGDTPQVGIAMSTLMSGVAIFT